MLDAAVISISVEEILIFLPSSGGPDPDKPNPDTETLVTQIVP